MLFLENGPSLIDSKAMLLQGLKPHSSHSRDGAPENIGSSPWFSWLSLRAGAKNNTTEAVP